jgi:hypothetical protein
MLDIREQPHVRVSNIPQHQIWWKSIRPFSNCYMQAAGQTYEAILISHLQGRAR